MIQVETVILNRVSDTQHTICRLHSVVGTGNLRDERKATRGAQVAFDNFNSIVFCQELGIKRTGNR